MAESDAEIFDWIIGLEDDCLKEVKQRVVSTAEYVFGERGRKVAEKYYRQLDGEEDYDLTEVDEDCNDCKERAKKLIEIAEFSKVVMDVLIDDKITQLLKDIDINNVNNLEDTVQKIVDNSLFEIDEETKNKIKSRILLEFCKKLLQQK